MKLLSAIFFGHWLIDQQWVEQVALPHIVQLRSGEISLAEFNKQITEGKQASTPSIVSPTGLEDKYISGKAANGSVGIINMQGPLMKADGFCGEPGMITMGNWVKQMANDPKISAIVFNMDTPGGTVSGTMELANIIKAVQKPTIAFVDDMAASAGMWIASAADEIVGVNPLAQVGSIGVYTRFADFGDYYKERGIKINDVYSRLSPEKNKAYREAQQGNLEPMRDDLDKLAIAFRETMQTNRGDKLSEEVLKGGMYYATDALSFGLMDQVLNFEQTIARARELAGGSKPKRVRQVS